MLVLSLRDLGLAFPLLDEKVTEQLQETHLGFSPSFHVFET